MAPPTVNGGIQPNPRKRRRSARSCQECQRRKVKCDRSEPCSHCVLSKKQCHYGPGSAQASRIVDGRAPASQIRASNGHGNGPYATPPTASTSVIGPSPASDASRLTGCAPEAQLTAQPSRRFTESSQLGAPTNANLDNLETGSRDERISLNKSRLFGQSHWTYSPLVVSRENRPRMYFARLV